MSFACTPSPGRSGSGTSRAPCRRPSAPGTAPGSASSPATTCRCDVDHVVGQPAAVRVAGSHPRARRGACGLSAGGVPRLTLSVSTGFGSCSAGSDPAAPASTAWTMSSAVGLGSARRRTAAFRIPASSGLTTNCPYNSASRSGVVRLNWSFFLDRDDDLVHERVPEAGDLHVIAAVGPSCRRVVRRQHRDALALGRRPHADNGVLVGRRSRPRRRPG